MKNKYLILSDGKSSHTLKWAKELSRYYDLYLITLNGYNDKILLYINIEKIYVLNENVNSMGGNYKLLLKYFDIKRIVASVKPDFLNAHYLSSYGILAALVLKNNKNTKLIQSTWGTDILVTPFSNRIRLLMAKFALNQANLITSDSYFMSDKIREICKNTHILTFPFGLDRVDLISKIDKDENLIFSNRALSKNYNIDKIIIWFSKLENKSLKLIVANDGEMKSELINLVSKLRLKHRVEFVGFLNKNEQEHYYKIAKYYISIPSSDSTAVSLLEAMSFGCYPILSNLPANREWIIDGLNGSFFSNSFKIECIDDTVSLINRKIIDKKAIFEKSIKFYVETLNNLR